MNQFHERQEQALSGVFVLMMRLAWVLVMTAMVIVLGSAGLVLGAGIGIAAELLKSKL